MKIVGIVTTVVDIDGCSGGNCDSDCCHLNVSDCGGISRGSIDVGVVVRVVILLGILSCVGYGGIMIVMIER